MKKFWKVLGITALVASLAPYRVEHNTDTDEKSVQALLWKVSSRPSENGDGRRRVSLDVGFLKPGTDPEAHLYEDDATWCCAAPVEEDAVEEDTILF